MNHWPFPWNHLGEAHAYQLTHCGTPCVFYDHYMNADLQKQIKALLKIRKRHGISNRSKVCGVGSFTFARKLVSMQTTCVNILQSMF